MNEIINLRLSRGGNKGLLRVSVKTGDNSYDCLAVAVVNEECYKKLVRLQGDYKSNKE